VRSFFLVLSSFFFFVLGGCAVLGVRGRGGAIGVSELSRPSLTSFLHFFAQRPVGRIHNMPSPLPKQHSMEMEFEYGYNLKIYPDDPIQVAMKGQGGGGASSGPSIGNWISNLLSPVDASGVSQPSSSIKED
jgi:hypothetical protein